MDQPAASSPPPAPSRTPLRLLVLGGSGEARGLAEALAGEAGVEAQVSLAGATRDPRPLPLPVRRGGFGGAAGQAAFLQQQRIGAVIDATHPFAARIGPRTAALCQAAGIPYLRLTRPGWIAAPGDRWTRLAGAEDAAAVIPGGARVFLATGRLSLPDFAALAPGRTLLCRVVDPPSVPFPYQGGWLTGRPPFTPDSEAALFRDLAIDWLVAKDAGGAGGWPKLAAARTLGLPVALLDRPRTEGEAVQTVDAALDWLRAL